MEYPQKLTRGRLIRRYKRFLADVELDDGTVITAHTANTGAMLGCATPGSRVWLSRSANPGRKYIHTWEIVQTSDGVLVGINSLLSPVLVREGIESGSVEELQGYLGINREVKYGRENSRIDLLLIGGREPDCYVEVKNVTAMEQAGVAVFPDAGSARGRKHLRELMQMVHAGKRAVIFFVVQRADVRRVRPADRIDPEYGGLLRQALRNGVEALAYRADVSPEQIRLRRSLPVSV